MSRKQFTEVIQQLKEIILNIFLFAKNIGIFYIGRILLNSKKNFNKSTQIDKFLNGNVIYFKLSIHRKNALDWGTEYHLFLLKHILLAFFLPSFTSSMKMCTRNIAICKHLCNSSKLNISIHITYDKLQEFFLSRETNK
jgi:hypothetical protein